MKNKIYKTISLVFYYFLIYFLSYCFRFLLARDPEQLNYVGNYIGDLIGPQKITIGHTPMLHSMYTRFGRVGEEFTTIFHPKLEHKMLFKLKFGDYHKNDEDIEYDEYIEDNRSIGAYHEYPILLIVNTPGIFSISNVEHYNASFYLLNSLGQKISFSRNKLQRLLIPGFYFLNIIDWEFTPDEKYKSFEFYKNFGSEISMRCRFKNNTCYAYELNGVDYYEEDDNLDELVMSFWPNTHFLSIVGFLLLLIPPFIIIRGLSQTRKDIRKLSRFSQTLFRNER